VSLLKKKRPGVYTDLKAAKKIWQHYPGKPTKKQTGHTL